MTRRITSLSLFAAIMLAVSFALVNVFSFIVPFIIISIFVTLMGVTFSDEILDDEDRGGLTFFISIFTAICLIAIAVLIFVKPDIIYRDVHFGWLIALSVLSAIIMLSGVMSFEGEWDADSFMFISIIVNIASVVVILVAVIVSLVFLSESMNVYQIIGGILILGFSLFNEIVCSKERGISNEKN